MKLSYFLCRTCFFFRVFDPKNTDRDKSHASKGCSQKRFYGNFRLKSTRVNRWVTDAYGSTWSETGNLKLTKRFGEVDVNRSECRTQIDILVVFSFASLVENRGPAFPYRNSTRDKFQTARWWLCPIRVVRYEQRELRVTHTTDDSFENYNPPGVFQ